MTDIAPPPQPQQQEVVSGTLQLGVYDWLQTFQKEDTQVYEHDFINWVGYRAGGLAPFLNGAQSRGRCPIVTVEPKEDKKVRRKGLLQDIVTGRYDKHIQLIGQDIAKFGRPVVVRLMHEFDVPGNASRYPWVTANDGAYVSAFKYLVTGFRKYANNIVFVWSPKGEQSMQKFYPGPGYVDLVSCSLYNYPEWNMAYYGRTLSFKEVMDKYYHNLYIYGKPIMIAEFGADKGPSQEAWVQDALLLAPQYPLLESLIYFNAPDSVSWGYGLQPPNFGISPEYWKL